MFQYFIQNRSICTKNLEIYSLIYMLIMADELMMMFETLTYVLKI